MDIAEQHALAVGLGQGGKRFAQAIGQLGAGKFAQRAGAAKSADRRQIAFIEVIAAIGLVELIGGAGAAAADPVDTGVGGDAKNPGAKVGIAAEQLQARKGFEECVLHQIHRLGLVANVRHAQMEHRPLEAVDELAERRAVAIKGAGDQLLLELVHQTPPRSHPRQRISAAIIQRTGANDQGPRRQLDANGLKLWQYRRGAGGTWRRERPMARMGGNWLVAAAAILAIAAGCQKKPAPDAPAAAAQAQPEAKPASPATPLPQAATAAAVPAPAAATAVQAVEAAEAQALVDAWLQAQNKGDFEAYQKLYAQRMTGVRRSGEVAKSFARPGWLADRRRMFAKQMQVTASEVQITAGPTAAVQFSQQFASGNFSDVGPKRLVLVREAGEVRIAREEMLASQVLDGALPAEPLPAEQLAIALHGGDQVWLAVAPAGKAPAQGAVKLWSREGPATASRPSQWPEALQAWRDRDVVLYGPAGEVCRAQVEAAELVAQVVPHFGRVQSWKGEDGAPAAGDQEVAQEIMDQVGTALVLGARLKPNRGDCRGAVWGRASNLAPAAIYDRADMPASSLRVAAETALRGLEKYKKFQREFQEQVPAPRPAFWDLLDGAKAEVTLLVGPGKQVALVGARAGDFCGGFGAELITAWDVKPLPMDDFKLRLISDERGGDLQMPVTAADVDGDGEPELIAPRQIWRRSGATWRPVTTWALPDFDCPC